MRPPVERTVHVTPETRCPQVSSREVRRQGAARGQLPTGKGNFISAVHISICLLADRTCAFEVAHAMMITIGNRPCAPDQLRRPLKESRGRPEAAGAGKPRGAGARPGQL